ncbi:suppressor of fused homolog [Tribolium castaneum]|uniref:suppressor of fused homolog n=1 Tax=Tribolium castaneum TaxID=7070 RepID=UPI0001757EF5|nr:PREDICTED: suppressor of fused homolog [Tribolium castaneum]XP_008201229.1 PREDICTED: suppressor of fused homolog [Tribolium castaneum]XP_975412.2 PREDICTED: suppressor of fused homolog [Tribolium castaneum]|eukprot:XP_008201227.1 PREDICTED: suppressor of fused homolog [Tribolium castaneum]
MNEAAALPHGPPMNILPPTPAGLESLYTLCRKIYPDQANPLQVTALIKYWLGGPDPLDYISMYANPGIPQENIPPHWHYISFGLSDLHGDGRVHDVSGANGVSGFGFELTFRLKREPEETAPPTWPATLMQSLAKYVFQSGNTLCAGDHVSWHCALDSSESRIQHMLMTTDVHLKSIQTPFGSVDFVQIVGICAEELKAAQQWNGAGVLDMITRIPSAGGPWFITDMRRGESIFELDLNAHEEVERGFELEGSNLSGVSARCSWVEQDPARIDIMHLKEKSDCDNFQAQEDVTLLNSPQKPLQSGNFEQNRSSSTNFKMDESTELLHIKKLEGVHLVFNLEAGSLLPLAIRGRVRHGRHFTFKSVLGETAITLVAGTVTGTLVNSEHPYVAQGSWLQILITDDLAQDMAVTFQVLATPEALSLPKTFSWPDKKLSVTIVADKL